MNDPKDKVKAFSMGGVDYITKPFELKEVEARIKTHITICEQRKRLQESLEEKYRNIFENAIEGMFQMSRDGKLITVNPQCALIFGYAGSEEMITECNECNRNPIFSQNDCDISRILETNSGVKMCEVQSTRKNGEFIWVSVKARAIKSPLNGEILFYDGFVEDITLKKETEEKLSRSEAELRALIESMNDVILAIDRRGKCVKVPETSADPLYRPSREFIGKTLQEIYPELDMSKYWADIEAALNIQVPVSIEYSLNIDEKEHWFMTVISPLDEDTALWVARNVTDMKKTELRLAETNIAMKVLLETMEEAKKDLESRVASNFNNFILPHLQKIKDLGLRDTQRAYMDVIEKNLNNIVSPFLKDINQFNLTATEVSVAQYVKSGRSTKEIADILSVSKGAVDIHRYNIRKKLGINNEKTSLRLHLMSLRS